MAKKDKTRRRLQRRLQQTTQPTAETNPTPSGGYATHVRDFHAGNLRVINGKFSNNTQDIVYRGNGNWVLGAGYGEDNSASVNLGDANHGDVTFDAWSNRPNMVAGGDIERLTGNLDHEPGAEPPTGHVFGYSAPEPGIKCECGFEAYRFSERCPKCDRRLR